MGFPPRGEGGTELRVTPIIHSHSEKTSPGGKKANKKATSATSQLNAVNRRTPTDTLNIESPLIIRAPKNSKRPGGMPANCPDKDGLGREGEKGKVDRG